MSRRMFKLPEKSLVVSLLSPSFLRNLVLFVYSFQNKVPSIDDRCQTDHVTISAKPNLNP